MAKLDRLGWAAGRAFVAHGVRVGIRTNRPEVLEGLEQYFPLGWKPCAGERVHHLYSLIVGGEERPNVRRYHLLYVDALRVVRTMELQDIFVLLEYDLEVYVAERARRRVFVHAGAVGGMDAPSFCRARREAAKRRWWPHWFGRGRPITPTNMPCSTLRAASTRTPDR